METTLTSGNLQSILRLLDEKDANPTRVTNVLASGILADVFDPNAKLGNREAIRTALGLHPLKIPEEAVTPTVIPLGEFTVNYDETIAEKLAAITDPKCIGWHNRDWATDEKFPDARRGKKRFKASAVHFGKLMPDEEIAKWCTENKKVRATPKEGIDIARVSPRPTLDNVMPLALAGQFFVVESGNRHALYFDRDSRGRYLFSVWLRPGERWGGGWFFLVLEELPSVA